MSQSANLTWNGPLAKQIARASAAQGLNQAAERLAGLAKPLTPNLDGDLEASQQIHQVTPDTVEQGSQVQYDTVYAVDQHEHLEFNHTTDPNPNAQAKFLEQPAREHEGELMGIVGANIRRGFG